jgi:hypothetical protein
VRQFYQLSTRADNLEACADRERNRRFAIRAVVVPIEEVSRASGSINVTKPVSHSSTSIVQLYRSRSHANAIDHSPLVEKSRHYGALLENIRAGRDCVIADIAFCDPRRSANLQQVIARQIPNCEIDWIYFENAPDKCRRNIERRARERPHNDLDALEKFQGLYFIPDEVTPIPVYGSP